MPSHVIWWIYITTDGWTNTAHSVACRELGFFFPQVKNDDLIHEAIIRANVELWESDIRERESLYRKGRVEVHVWMEIEKQCVVRNGGTHDTSLVCTRLWLLEQDGITQVDMTNDTNLGKCVGTVLILVNCKILHVPNADFSLSSLQLCWSKTFGLLFQ